jgi:hypothetical protein
VKGLHDLEVVAEVDTEVGEVIVTLRSGSEEKLQVLEVDTVRNVAQHGGGASFNVVYIDCLKLISIPKLDCCCSRRSLPR